MAAVWDYFTLKQMSFVFVIVPAITVMLIDPVRNLIFRGANKDNQPPTIDLETYYRLQAQVTELSNTKVLPTEHIEFLQDYAKTPHRNTVVFAARTTQYILIVRGGKNVVFDDTLINIGDGYNDQTGEFVAPVSGIYEFAAPMSGIFDQLVESVAEYFDICACESKLVFLQNDVRKFRLSATGTHNVMVQLAVGDQVSFGNAAHRPISILRGSAFSGCFLTSI